ncbi:Uma2 family endonuclease [Actinomadura gamaensis]|uniref:Uma2 family endonuclease n=1 Tax=Actinomadura gamaensis TaxID=1763541 RepID=A0ABV9TYK3_9ACTN
MHDGIFNEETRAKALEELARFGESKGFTFSKFESLGDEIIMLAGTRWEHDGIIDLIKEQVPRGRFCKLSSVDLLLTSDPGEPVPALVVVPDQLKPGAKPWAHETELLVEVVSQRNYREDYHGKRRRYAESGAPQYLLVDPREGVCVLHDGPQKAEGKYRNVTKSVFGESIRGLLCMDGRDLDTSEFPRYV